MTTSKGADILVLAAYAPELVGMRATLGTALAGVVRGLRVVCATVGVGLPTAGAGAMRHLRDAKPRAVILLGSCGAYPKKPAFAPLEAVVPERIQLVDTAVVLDKAAFPAPMQTVMEPDPVLSHGLATCLPGVRRGQLASTLSITTDDTLAARIGKRTGCDTENLEAFSVGVACAGLPLPFAAVLVVTNLVGSEGREQWSKHRRKAADHSARLLLDWIHRGAQGLPAR